MQQFFWVAVVVHCIKVDVSRQQKTTFEGDTSTPSSCDPFARDTVTLSPEGGFIERERFNGSQEPSLNSLEVGTRFNAPCSLSVRATDTDALSVVPSKLANCPVAVATLCVRVIVRSPSSISFDFGLNCTSILIELPH